MTTPTALDETDDVERELSAMLGARIGRAARRGETLGDLGLDGYERARLLHDIEQSFRRPLPDALLSPSTTVGALAEQLARGAYWEYPRPPTSSAADMARADFLLLALRPALHTLFRGALRAGWRYRVEGAQHVPRRGPFVLVANHASHADTPCALSALPLARVNDTHPLAADDYFFRAAWKGRVVHALFNALPLDRHSPAESAMKAALDLLAEGRGVVIFPEGTRSPDGAMRGFRRGVGMLLARKPYPAVPVHIAGAHDVLPKGRSWPGRGTLRVRVGSPVTFEAADDTREGWQQVASALEARVRTLAQDVR